MVRQKKNISSTNISHSQTKTTKKKESQTKTAFMNSIVSFFTPQQPTQSSNKSSVIIPLSDDDDDFESPPLSQSELQNPTADGHNNSNSENEEDIPSFDLGIDSLVSSLQDSMVEETQQKQDCTQNLLQTPPPPFSAEKALSSSISPAYFNDRETLSDPLPELEVINSPHSAMNLSVSEPSSPTQHHNSMHSISSGTIPLTQRSSLSYKLSSSSSLPKNEKDDSEDEIIILPQIRIRELPSKLINNIKDDDDDDEIILPKIKPNNNTTDSDDDDNKILSINISKTTTPIKTITPIKSTTTTTTTPAVIKSNNNNNSNDTTDSDSDDDKIISINISKTTTPIKTITTNTTTPTVIKSNTNSLFHSPFNTHELTDEDVDITPPRRSPFNKRYISPFLNNNNILEGNIKSPVKVYTPLKIHPIPIKLINEDNNNKNEENNVIKVIDLNDKDKVSDTDLSDNNNNNNNSKVKIKRVVDDDDDDEEEDDDDNNDYIFSQSHFNNNNNNNNNNTITKQSSFLKQFKDYSSSDDDDSDISDLRSIESSSESSSDSEYDGSKWLCSNCKRENKESNKYCLSCNTQFNKNCIIIDNNNDDDNNELDLFNYDKNPPLLPTSKNVTKIKPSSFITASKYRDYYDKDNIESDSEDITNIKQKSKSNNNDSNNLNKIISFYPSPSKELRELCKTKMPYFKRIDEIYGFDYMNLLRVSKRSRQSDTTSSTRSKRNKTTNKNDFPSLGDDDDDDDDDDDGKKKKKTNTKKKWNYKKKYYKKKR